jgi:hypothetical protein
MASTNEQLTQQFLANFLCRTAPVIAVILSDTIRDTFHVRKLTEWFLQQSSILPLAKNLTCYMYTQSLEYLTASVAPVF